MTDRTVLDAEQTNMLGQEIAAQLRVGDVVVLSGPMGAGKTTLTGGIAQGLGVEGRVQSPSFMLVRIHPSSSGGLALAHVDAQRLGEHAEFTALELEDVLATGVVVIEWGEGHVEGLGARQLHVTIEPEWESNSRRIHWSWQ